MFGQEAKDVREEGEDTEDEATIGTPTKSQGTAFSSAVEADQNGLKLNGNALKPGTGGSKKENSAVAAAEEDEKKEA